MLSRAAVLAAFVLLPTTATGAATRSPCERLRGRDLAPAKSVKLVDRDSLLRSCALPRGRVWRLENGIDAEFTNEKHSVRHVAGAFAIITNSFIDKYTTAEHTYVVSLRTGVKRTLADSQLDGGRPLPPDTFAQKAFATSGGRAVATVTAPGDLVRVVALGASGTLQTLGEAPRADLSPDSLTLKGARAVWMQSGHSRSAALP